MSDPPVCHKCGTTQLKWATLRRRVPIDTLQCQRCGCAVVEEDWVPPLVPLLPSHCINCGDRREQGVCMTCGLSKDEDIQVHDELRQLISPTHDLFHAARQASHQGRRLLALKLASAAAVLQPQDQGELAHALRVWLLSAIGESHHALADARTWVEQSRDPSAVAWASLGQQQKFAGYTGAAVESFSRALQLNPNQASIRAERATLLMELHREGQAMEDACLVLESASSDSAILKALEVAEQLADNFEATLRDDEVELLLSRAAEKAERSAKLLAHRARLAALGGDLGAARRDLKRAKRMKPGLEIYARVEQHLKPQRTSWWKW